MTFPSPTASGNPSPLRSRKSISPVLAPVDAEPDRKPTPPPSAFWSLVLNRLTPRPPTTPSVGSGTCGAPARALLICSPVTQLARARQYSGVSPPTDSGGPDTLQPAGPRHEPSAG